MKSSIATLFVMVCLTGCGGVGDRTASEKAGSPAVPPDALAATQAVAGKAAVPPREVVVPAGTALAVRLDHAVSTRANSPGERFTGSLARPVEIDGSTVLPAGTRVAGVVRQSSPSGRLKGRAVLTLALDTVELDGRTHPVSAAPVSRVSDGHKKRNWAWIGGSSGAGALIGGLTGGGKGAAIGAGAGAAAGTAGAAMTGQKQVSFPAESLLTFRLNKPLAVRG